MGENDIATLAHLFEQLSVLKLLITAFRHHVTTQPIMFQCVLIFSTCIVSFLFVSLRTVNRWTVRPGDLISAPARSSVDGNLILATSIGLPSN